MASTCSMASTSFAYGSRGDAAPFNPTGPRNPAVLLYDGSRRGRVRSYRTRGNRRTRPSTVGRASDDRTDALDGDSGARGSSVSVDTLDATGRGANDEDGQKKNDEWWSWTKRWAVGDSDEDEDEEERDPSSDSIRAVREAEEEEGEAVPFLERVPLPPWLKFQVDRVWKTGDEASVAVEASAGSTAVERHKLESLADVVETLESPSTSAADLGEISGRRAEFVDQALRGANEASVKATEAALDKLSAALAAVEARERAVVATDAAAKANDVLKEKAAAAGLNEKGEVVELESWEFPGPSTPVGDEERQRLKDLEAALKVARLKSEEARLASNALSEAVDDVAKVRAELESMGYQSEKERAGLQSSLGAAAERVKTASRASQAALFAAGAQIFAVVDMSKEGVVGWVRGVTDKDSSSNDFDIAAVTAPLVETAEAIELSSTIARITQWSAARAASIQKIIAGGSISPDVGVAGSDVGDKPMTAAEVGRMIQPALQTVVAQSLVPAGPQEIRSARVACSMAAWIYYLPTTHAALHRYGLRIVVSSLDQVKSQAGKPKDANNVVARTSSFTMAQMEEMKERVTAAADAAILELERAAKLEAKDPERETAAREAAKQAAAAAKELESLSIIIEEKEREKKAVREASSMFDPEGSSSVEEAPKPTPLKKMDFDPVKKGNNAAVSSYNDRSLPVNYCVAADDATGEIWVVIEGSTSLKSWQTNLTFQPVVFEDPTWDVRVHRGSYDAARAIYDRIEQAVVDHVNAFGTDRAKVHVTGHSIGGSLAALIALMLIMRGKVPRDVINDVWTFGSPYVMCGGEALLARLGLPRSFLRSVAMGKDIVPRSFSCYYPQWARKALEFAPGSLKVDTNKQPSFLEEEMFYSPMGDMYLLQALHGSAHPLLPSGPGLYVLEGDGMYEMLVERVIVDEAGDGDEELWLTKGRRGGSWGEWTHDESSDSDSDSEEAIRIVSKGDESNRDAVTREAQTAWERAVANREAKKKMKESRSRRKEDGRSRRLNRLACLTQSEAALTATLLLGSVESESLVSSDTREVMLQDRGRDAAQRVLLNTPHPLTVLSDPRAYGAKGSISRHHNPFNYLRALGKTRRTWDGGSSEVNFDSPDVGPR
uniref:Fungal lipase-type domain-containing protein n=1 Tax=Micromonas pusilla TaxID=38833 RepID=A0A6U0NUM9_MICPS